MDNATHASHAQGGLNLALPEDGTLPAGLRCRLCRTPLLTPHPTPRRLLPLPSARWAEMADYLNCAEDGHGHSHGHAHDADEPSAILDTVLRPGSNVIMYNHSRLMVPQAAILPEAMERDAGELRCRRCRTRLGTASTYPFESENACMLQLHAVCGEKLQESTLQQPLPFHSALPSDVKDALAELVELAQAQSHSRFALLPRGAAGKGANAPHVLLWLPSLAPVLVSAAGLAVSQGPGKLSLVPVGAQPAPRLRALYLEGCLRTLSPADIGGSFGEEAGSPDSFIK
jgi:hypothetical protein